MTQEALKLALEALTYIYTETTADEDELIDQAITTIKEALAQTQDAKCKYCIDGCPACDARRQSNVLP